MITQERIQTLKKNLKKSVGQINKYAAMSTRGKCTNDQWISAIDDFKNLLDEYLNLMSDMKEKEIIR